MNIELSDAAAQLPDLVKRARRGEEVVIVRDGVPAVRLVPVKTRPAKRKLGFGEGDLTVEQALEPLTEEELREWE